MMHIVVPVDGSLLAEQAIEPAVALLRRAAPPHALTLLRVVDYGTLTLDISGLAPPITESAYQAALEGGQEYLARVAARRILHGVRVETMTLLGNAPASVICQVAEESKADLVVMASHRRTGFAHFAFGSVAESVMRQSAIPTLIIHKDDNILPGPDRDELLTILVPLDGTAVAEEVLPAAMALAAQVHGAIRLLRVLPAHTASTPSDRMLTSEAQAYFAQMCAAIEAHGVPVHQTIAWGDIVDHIIAAAHAYQTDILAIATHGRTGFDLLRHGSVTLDVSRQLDMPLLVLHGHAMATAAQAPLTLHEPQQH
jgi:nucleotide-binding universal stress UspA family protein